MKPYKKDIWILVTRNLSGEATSGEQQKLHRWLGEDPEHKKFYNDLKAFWQQSLTYSEEDSFLFDYDNGLQKLRNKIATEKLTLSPPKKPPIRAGKRISQRLSWGIAAAIIFLIAATTFYLVARSWEAPVQKYQTGAQEQLIITLPDSSVVRLNKNSVLTYREGLTGTNRRVHLQGEAFFDVTANEARPFVIQTSSGKIRVLGTSFLVKQQAQKSLLVVVKKGTVALRGLQSAEQESVQINAGQAAILNGQTQQITLRQAAVDNYLRWITGQLVFDNMSLEKVFNQLESIYDINIKVDNASIHKLKLTAYTQKTSLKEVLYMIGQVMDLQYRQQGRTIVWSVRNNSVK